MAVNPPLDYTHTVRSSFLLDVTVFSFFFSFQCVVGLLIINTVINNGRQLDERLVFLATCHHIYSVIIMNVLICGK